LYQIEPVSVPTVDFALYHINGRGWHTAEALPRMIDGLKAQVYRFELLRDYL
jgi:peptidoglycan/xylan/chitin deacetylase (PgdA/CDA1 family)